MKRLTIFLLILMIIPCVSAATIQGSIYNLDLEKESNIFVEINTEPIQKHLSTEGTYSFTVNQGEYILKAYDKYNEQITEEEITITQEGEYLIDLFLFPNLEEDKLDINDSDFNIYEEETEDYWPIPLITIMIFLIAMAAKRRRKKKQKEDKLETKVIHIIKKQGGRITQKELRKKFPLSEAKISLVLTDLENQKKIKKIKKGRSNVIKLT